MNGHGISPFELGVPQEGFPIGYALNALDPARVAPDDRSMSLADVSACIALGTIEGALVALPRPLALERLARLRSPGWALVAPGSLLVGTFGVLALPSLATGLAVLAAVATPLLALIAAVAVVHGSRRALLLAPLALGAVAMAGTGLAAELAASLLTALGCLTLGAGLVRLTPVRWLQLGLLSMALIDVLLITAGIGQHAATLLMDALGGVHPTFHRATLGPISTDYPDLVLAGVLGGMFAGRPIQRRAAVLVAVLAASYGGLLTIFDMLPATVPLVVALVVVEWGPRLRRLRPGALRRGSTPDAAPLPVEAYASARA